MATVKSARTISPPEDAQHKRHLARIDALIAKGEVRLGVWKANKSRENYDEVLGTLRSYVRGMKKRRKKYAEQTPERRMLVYKICGVLHLTLREHLPKDFSYKVLVEASDQVAESVFAEERANVARKGGKTKNAKLKQLKSEVVQMDQRLLAAGWYGPATKTLDAYQDEIAASAAKLGIIVPKAKRTLTASIRTARKRSQS